MQNYAAGPCCRTKLQDHAAGPCCRTMLRDKAAGPCCRTMLQVLLQTDMRVRNYGQYLRGEKDRAGRVYEGGLYILLGKEVRYWDAHQNRKHKKRYLIFFSLWNSSLEVEEKDLKRNKVRFKKNRNKTRKKKVRNHAPDKAIDKEKKQISCFFSFINSHLRYPLLWAISQYIPCNWNHCISKISFH